MTVLTFAALAASLAAGAAHADVVYSISGPADVSPGDVNDVFDVLITNTSGSSDVNIAAFAFQVTAADTDITLNSADTSPSAAPYIFAGDSFDDINGFTLDVPNPNIPAQTLTGVDLTNDSANVTLAGGQTLSLGEVFFSVAPGAAAGPFTVSFSCFVYPDPGTGLITQPAADCNSLSDGSGNGVNVDGMNSARITVDPAAVPEPGTLLLAVAGALALAGRKSIRQRRRGGRISSQ